MNSSFLYASPHRLSIFYMSYPTDISITDSKNFANFSATYFIDETCKIIAVIYMSLNSYMYVVSQLT